MQAIITKVIPATNTRPTRIKAGCARGGVTITQPAGFDLERSRFAAASRLVTRFMAEDLRDYKTPFAKNPWGRLRITGTLPSGDYCHVFTSQPSNRLRAATTTQQPVTKHEEHLPI